jgi:hypothetical protein
VGLFPEGSSDGITGEYEIIDGILDNAVDFTPSVNNAWNAAMASRVDVTVIPTEIGSLTFGPGTWRSGAFNIADGLTVTLDGGADDISTIDTGTGCSIVLVGGAKAVNVLWALHTALTTGANNVSKGSILAGTAITIGLGSKVNGDVVARSAITFGSEVAVHGCVVALSAIIFGNESVVTVSANA